MAEVDSSKAVITFALEIIEPSEAQRILNEHDESIAAGEIVNRARKPSAIRRYAADLTSGQWFAATGETLKFQTLEKVLRGRNLVDGQNRLAACALANIPLICYIARGVAREAFAYVDGGVKRTLKDVLKISIESDAPALATTLLWLGQWDADNLTLLNGQTVSTQRARKLLEADPAIRLSVTKAKAVKESRLIGIGLAAFLHRVFSAQDKPLADAFIQAVASGSRLESDDPFLLFRQRLIDNKGSRRKLPQRDIVALAMKAWILKRDGRVVKRLQYMHGRESFPSLATESREVVGADVPNEHAPLSVGLP